EKRSAELRADLERFARELAQAESTHEAAKGSFARARRLDERARAWVEALESRVALDSLTKRLAQVEAELEEKRQIERRLRTIRIDEKAFDALQKAENALERALAALAAASVGIRVRTRDRATIEIDEGQGDEGDAPGVAGGATKARPLDTNAWNEI